jgi:hypothetical protein
MTVPTVILENLDSEIESADDSDELEALHRGRDIERMTARQRSKLDAKYTEKLMVLPEGMSSLLRHMFGNARMTTISTQTTARKWY